MYAVIMLIDQIINIYIWTLLIYIGVGWLVAFRIVNPWQPIVRMIIDVLARIHEPLLSQVRRFLPDLGPVDISPIVLFLAAQFIRNLLSSSLSGSTARLGCPARYPGGGRMTRCNPQQSLIEMALCHIWQAR